VEGSFLASRDNAHICFYLQSQEAKALFQTLASEVQAGAPSPPSGIP
jgi:hypothetical protein